VQAVSWQRAPLSDYDLICKTIARNNLALDDRFEDCLATYTPDGSIAGHTGHAARPGSRYRAGHEIQLLEEDQSMTDGMPEPGNADDQRGSEPEVPDTAEFAKMRAVMRASEKHREGGVDPDLEDADADSGPDTAEPG